MPTVITKSIGTAARDYSTIATWEAALPANLVTADEQHVGQMYNDTEFVTTATTTIAGQTTDATRNIVLETGSAQSFRDHANKATNPIRYNASVGVGQRQTSTYTTNLDVATAYTLIRNIQLQNTGISGANIVLLDSVGGIKVDSCILDGDSSDAVATLYDASKYLNCAVLNRSSDADGAGIRSSYPTAAAVIAGCTIVRPNGLTIAGQGVVRTNGSAFDVTNTAVFGFTDFANGTLNGNYNQSDDATNIPGANSNGTRTYSTQFEDYGNTTPDFRAKSSGDLKNGTPDATNLPDDIIGTTRDATTPWVGCWEVPAAAAAVRPPAPVLIQQAVHRAAFW
jgi:hypothetical protein